VVVSSSASKQLRKSLVLSWLDRFKVRIFVYWLKRFILSRYFLIFQSLSFGKSHNLLTEKIFTLQPSVRWWRFAAMKEFWAFSRWIYLFYLGRHLLYMEILAVSCLNFWASWCFCGSLRRHCVWSIFRVESWRNSHIIAFWLL